MIMIYSFLDLVLEFDLRNIACEISFEQTAVSVRETQLHVTHATCHLISFVKND